MKAKWTIYKIVFILIIFLTNNNLYAQEFTNDLLKNSDAILDSKIKKVEARFHNNKVYLKIFIVGLPEKSELKIERSLDGSHFETIGSLNHSGDSSNIALMNCFTDEQPYKMTAFYRVTRCDNNCNTFSSELVTVEPQTSKAKEVQYTEILNY